ISTKYLGPTVDIHTGGVDNIFPHHQNEIAQSEAATGKRFVRYWMHCEHLLVNNKKMSKSLGNIITLESIVSSGFRADALRYLFVSSHYRSKLNFTWESIRHAENTLDRLNNFIERLPGYESDALDSEEIARLIRSTQERFEIEMDNDLNTPGAFAAVFEMIGRVNTGLDEAKLSTQDARAVHELMMRLDKVLDILSPGKKEGLSEEIEALIEERERARRMKDFKKADEIRKRLEEKGIVLEDTRTGVRWMRKFIK
ncbi:MAG: class I tRNA ligase family protein, partial [Candidatus Methanoperedens sp.]|nr:class I tRNA ligase family protein [Candidatus Methanoperedens sp.]